jgi:hypothetical protein
MRIDKNGFMSGLFNFMSVYFKKSRLFSYTIHKNGAKTTFFEADDISHKSDMDAGKKMSILFYLVTSLSMKSRKNWDTIYMWKPLN